MERFAWVWNTCASDAAACGWLWVDGWMGGWVGGWVGGWAGSWAVQSGVLAAAGLDALDGYAAKLAADHVRAAVTSAHPHPSAAHTLFLV
jgi:hypothetical protein